MPKFLAAAFGPALALSMLALPLALSLALSLVTAQPALAQAKKSAKCPAGFFESCMKACTSRGGQARFCPDYCEKQKAAKGC